MFVIFGLVAGAIFGGWRAKSRGGKTLDVLQYAAVHAMLFGIVGLFVTLIIHRMLV